MLIRYQTSIEKSLLPNQKLFVDRVARYFSTMNLAQMAKGLERLRLDHSKLSLTTPIIIQESLPKKSDLGEPSKPNKKDFNAEKELMISLSKWFIQHNPGFAMGSGQAIPAAAAKAEDKGAKKEEAEKKVEKEAYDLELTSFEAAKKIGLIKEVRTLTNLGLKEVINLLFFSIFIFNIGKRVS